MLCGYAYKRKQADTLLFVGVGCRVRCGAMRVELELLCEQSSTPQSGVESGCLKSNAVAGLRAADTTGVSLRFEQQALQGRCMRHATLGKHR